MADPVSTNLNISVQPIDTTPRNLAPAAIQAQRANIEPEVIPQVPVAGQPAEQPATPESHVPVQPAAPQHDPVPPVPEAGTHSLLQNPALAQFLDQEASSEPAPQQQPVATEPAAVQPAPAQTQPAPAGPTISFDGLFDAAAPAAEPQGAEASPEIAALKDMISQLNDRIVASGGTPESGTLAPVNLTDAQRETYSDSIPVIEQIVLANTAALRTEFSGMIAGLRDEIEASIGTVRTGVSELHTSSYDQQRHLMIPDQDALVNHPSFQAYLQNLVPYSGGETVGSKLKAAHLSSDLPKVVAIMKDFRESLAAQPAIPATQVMETMTQPATTAAPQPASTTTQQQAPQAVLNWSDRQLAYRENRANRLSDEDFNKIDLAFRNAIAKGLVDYNK